MKKTLVLTESLIGNTYTAFTSLLSKSNNNHFVFFKFAKERAEIAGVLSNFNSIISILKNSNMSYEFIEEDGLDEYFFANSEEDEIYITPTDSISQVVSSASLMKYEGNVYVYGRGYSEPEIFNCQPLIRAFSYKRSAGSKGLNLDDASYSHIESSKCYFTLNSKKYVEKIKSRASSKNQGVEGFTQICESNPRFLMKIWDISKKQYEIDKIMQMVNYPYKQDEIGLPLAIIYNDQNNPIGVVMNNYSGEDYNLRKLHLLDQPLIYVKQILEQLIWLESHGFLHRDVNHNIIVNKENKKVHIIDTDSIQFKQFPASATSSDSQNALPEVYETQSVFYNTIDVSYTGLSILATAFVDINKLFGIWTNGFCPLDAKTFSVLEIEAPDIARFLKAAHTIGQPISLARQLSAINQLLTKPKTRVSEFSSANKIPFDIEQDFILGESEEIIIDEDESMYEEIIIDDTKYEEIFVSNNTSFKTKFSDNDKSNINVTSSKEYSNNSNKFSAWLKDLILSMFMTGTVPEGVSKDEIWKIFIKSRLWKKPLLGSLTAIFTIIVLIIAIIQM